MSTSHSTNVGDTVYQYGRKGTVVGHDLYTPRLKIKWDDGQYVYLFGAEVSKTAPEKVSENSLWRHSSGRCYRVLMLTNQEADNPKYPVTVVYRGTNGRVWSRPLSDWHRSMTFIEA